MVGNGIHCLFMVKILQRQAYGPKLKALRQDAGLTQVDAAEAVGIGRSTLASIESGNDPAGRDTLAALATFYKVSVDWLLSGPSAAVQPKRSDLVNDPNELAWLDMWRAFDDSERTMALRVLKAIAQPQSGRA